MKIPRLVSIAALIIVCAVHADPVEQPNRFIFYDGTLAISRPDKSWKFEIDASEPPVLASMSSPDDAADVDIQVQQVPGATLAH